MEANFENKWHRLSQAVVFVVSVKALKKSQSSDPIQWPGLIFIIH